MKASIIIPFHDGSRETLRWTIQSALRQTYSNYEIILVDDGCTDENTIWSAKHMALKRHGTKIATQSGQGVAAARNFGARNSDGDVLLFLDSDDWIEPTFLEKTVPPLAFSCNIGIVSTDMHVFGEDTDSVVLAANYQLKNVLSINPIPNTSLISRVAFDQAGGYKQDVYEDWNLWIDILKRGWQTALVAEPLLHYRSRARGSRISSLKKEHQALVYNMRLLHPEIQWPSQ